MAGEIKQFKDANNNTHKVDITGVEGLQSALDGKVDIQEPELQMPVSINGGSSGYITNPEEGGGIAIFSDVNAMNSKVEIKSNGEVRIGTKSNNETEYLEISIDDSSVEVPQDAVFDGDVSVDGDISASTISGSVLDSTPTAGHNNKVASSGGVAAALAGKTETTTFTYSGTEIDVSSLLNNYNKSAIVALFQDVNSNVRLERIFSHSNAFTYTANNGTKSLAKGTYICILTYVSYGTTSMLLVDSLGPLNYEMQ